MLNCPVPKFQSVSVSKIMRKNYYWDTFPSFDFAEDALCGNFDVVEVSYWNSLQEETINYKLCQFSNIFSCIFPHMRWWPAFSSSSTRFKPFFLDEKSAKQSLPLVPINIYLLIAPPVCSPARYGVLFLCESNLEGTFLCKVMRLKLTWLGKEKLKASTFITLPPKKIN